METRRAFLSGCMAFLSFPLQKAPPKHSLRSFPPCKTCRRRRTQPIPAESGDYLHFLNGFAKSLVLSSCLYFPLHLCCVCVSLNGSKRRGKKFRGRRGRALERTESSVDRTIPDPR